MNDNSASRSRRHMVAHSRNAFTMLSPPCLYFSSPGASATSEPFPLPLGGVVGPSPDTVRIALKTVIVLCVLLAGCGPKPIPPKIIVERIVETVEVKVPVMVARVPPAELVTPLHPPRPEFVSPESPEASSALTAEGERILRGLIEDLLTRIAAWETWATAPEEK